jgi:hypothetical protein
VTSLNGPKDAPGLPEKVPASAADYEKLRYTQQLDAWLEEWKQQAASDAARIALEASRADARTARDAARADADRAAEVASLKSVQDAYVAVTQSSLDRALTRVNVVTASITAVTTIYTGLLALVYAAKSGEGRVLTGVAIIPALFLGLALFLVTVYAAMFKRTMSAGTLLPTGIGGQVAEIRLITFMRWCFAGVLARSWALHAGIVSLGIGVATLPVPFVQMPGGLQVTILLAGLVLVAGTAGWTWRKNK